MREKMPSTLSLNQVPWIDNYVPNIEVIITLTKNQLMDCAIPVILLRFFNCVPAKPAT